MQISRDVVFDESHHFYPRPSDASSTSLVDPLSFLFIPDSAIAHIPPSRFVPPPAPPSEPSSVVPSVESPSGSSSLAPDYTTKPPVTKVYTRRSVLGSSKPSLDSPSPGPSEPSSDEPSTSAALPEQLVRRGHGSCQPIYRYGFGSVTWQGFAGTVLSEPTSYRDAIHHPEW